MGSYDSGKGYDSLTNQPLLLFGVPSANVVSVTFDLSAISLKPFIFNFKALLLLTLVFYYRAVNPLMTTKSRFNDYQK